jgi:hypothetical protein
MKDQLVFNTNSAATIADSDNVGAFVRSADGNIITDHHIPGDVQAVLITQGLTLMSRLPGTVGNSYSFTVVDTWVSGPTGPLTFTEVAGAVVLDLHGLTPTQAQVVAALASSTYIYAEVGSPAGLITTNTILSFSGGQNTVIHTHLDVYSITAAGDGSPITHHHDTGGTTSLDVHITNPQVVAVDIDGIYDAVNNLLPANVGLIGSTRAAPGIANQTLQFTGAGVAADNVSTSNIMAQDVNAFGMMWDSAGGNWDRLQGNVADGLLVKISNTSLTVAGTVELGATTLAALESITVQNGAGVAAVNIQDGGNSITVDGSVSLTGEDRNWGAVGAATLRVAAEIGNASGMADFGAGATSAQTLRVVLANDDSVLVSDAALADGTIVSKAKILAVAGTAETAVSSSLAARKYLNIYNMDNQKIFVGGSGVSLSNGFPVSPGSYLELRAGANSAVYFVGSSTKTPEIRTLELA